MFRMPGDSQRPTYSYHGDDQGTDPEGTDPTSDPSTPLTIGSLRDMLKEATADIKSHVAEEISRNLAGLRAEGQTLNSRTDQTEKTLLGVKGDNPRRTVQAARRTSQTTNKRNFTTKNRPYGPRTKRNENPKPMATSPGTLLKIKPIPPPRGPLRNSQTSPIKELTHTALPDLYPYETTMATA
ncbi:Hypothetical predicted protein [Pelobates cultripes]|uniref:Uncharacterized protein n=1 Tax=Pelobates cultripes TaxID=61616 RepID=A0AAD1WKV5_PELCU|nr:Hypothetical predicted protein [Pelobates cultripes]